MLFNAFIISMRLFALSIALILAYFCITNGVDMMVDTTQKLVDIGVIWTLKQSWLWIWVGIEIICAFCIVVLLKVATLKD